MRKSGMVFCAVCATAGAALAGVIGVFFKQLVLPSDREHGHADDHQDKGGNA